MSGGGFVQADQYQGPNLIVATNIIEVIFRQVGNIYLFVLGFGTLRIRCLGMATRLKNCTSKILNQCQVVSLFKLISIKVLASTLLLVFVRRVGKEYRLFVCLIWGFRA